MAAKIDFERPSTPTNSRAWRHRTRPLQFSFFVIVVMFVCHRYIYQYLIQDKHAKYASATVLTSDTGLLQILDWQDRISRTKSTWQGKGSANIANCKAGTFTREDYFEFNTADGEGDWEYNDLEGVKAEAGQSLRGKIEVLPGEEDQKTDIAMQIVTRSNDQDDLSSLKWKRYGAGLDLRYEFKNQTDICTEVNMKVYLRPLVYLIRFNFITTLFDIVVQSHLRWEVFVMGVISLHGNIEMNNERSLDPLLVTYFLYVRSNTGNIRGQYQPFGIVMVENEQGSMSSLISPPLNDNFPFHPEYILMVSTSGDIYSESAWETWPNKTYAYGYQIYTESGNINASLLHGGWTNITSLYGNTSASIWTGVADHLIGLADEYPLNGIHSFTQSGNTMIRLVGGYISASNLTSQHYVGEGELELRYPDSWCGDIDARIGNGEIRLNATLLSDIQRGDGYVKAKRGEGDSQIEAHVGSGKLDIMIGDGSA